MSKSILVVVWLALLLALIAAPLALGVGPETVQPIYDGPDLDYQPSIARLQPGGQLMVVFERFGSPPYGDFYAAFSPDNGETWTAPVEILPSPLYERHPALVQRGPDDLALFYLVDETGGGAYRIHWATSADGLNWTPQGRVELGWASPGEINPHVIRESDGTLTMTYHRYGGPSYIAQSADDGVSWDQLQTQVSDGSAPLPRLAKRERDGLYIVSYQVNPGGNNLDIYAKISYDPHDWSGPQIPISTDINSHDSQPVVLEDGTLLVSYAKTSPGPYFDLYYRTSCDGSDWLPEVQVTYNPALYDTQPHPLLQGTPGHLILTWPHQDPGSPSPYQDHDVWVDSDLRIPPDLSTAAKEVDPAYFAPGGGLTYTLVLPNSGYGPTTAWLSDTVPASTTFSLGSLWASSGDYGYDPVAQTVTWTGMLSTCSQVTITFQVDTDPGLAHGDVVSNTAWLTDGAGIDHRLEATATAFQCDPVEILSVTSEADGCVVTFSAALSGTAPIDYWWDFGAFGSSTAPTPTVDFGASGTYSYQLTVENCFAVYSDTDAGEVTVSCEPPCQPVTGTAFSWAPLTPTVGEVVTFTGSATGTEPITYTWDWGDGRLGFGGSVTHVYTVAGAYEVVLTASNACSQQVVSETVTVVPPCQPVTGTVFSWAPLTPTVGEAVTFTGSATGTEPITYTWDWGDGRLGFGGSVTHVYTVAGAYEVVLTASNACSQQVVSETVTVVPPCQPVTGTVFSWAPLTPTVGEAVTFTGSATGTEPITYTWDWGDGRLGFGGSVTHVYTVAAAYEVVLTASNCATATDRATDTLPVVEETPPCRPVQLLTWTVDISGCRAAFSAEVTGTAPFTWSWAFGDGAISVAPTPTHAYSTSGAYTVTLRVGNCQGEGHDERRFSVEVSCEPPPSPRSLVYLPVVYRGRGP